MTASPRMPLYRNAMEPLVAEEVERQLHHLPPHLVNYINPAQVMAYALNRLPALYATSEDGWRRQQLRAKQQLKNQIVMAVRQGLAAVQKDPLRVSTPLKLRSNLEGYSVGEKQVRSPAKIPHDWNLTQK